MYLPVPTQLDCATAWLQAVRHVNSQRGHEAYNVIIDVEDPIRSTTLQNPIVGAVDLFLKARKKSIATVSNTIFPYALYRRYGSPEFINAFRERVLPKVRRSERWSGYYFERMISGSDNEGGQLGNIIGRMKDSNNPSLNKYELAIFDPRRDVDGSPYGGQCLSFLSFKILSGTPSVLNLTAIYRNHYYIEKLLGNLIGLGQLMAYMASEANLSVGSLTVVSTHATIDSPGGAKRSEIETLINTCQGAIRVTPNPSLPADQTPPDQFRKTG